MKLAATGFLLTVVVTMLLGVWKGSGAIPGAVSFGVLATAIQVASVRLVRAKWNDSFHEVMWRWGAGMGLRLAGIVVLGATVTLDRELFQPLPSAFGYLGVLVPLLFMELKFVR